MDQIKKNCPQVILAIVSYVADLYCKVILQYQYSYSSTDRLSLTLSSCDYTRSVTYLRIHNLQASSLHTLSYLIQAKLISTRHFCVFNWGQSYKATLCNKLNFTLTCINFYVIYRQHDVVFLRQNIMPNGTTMMSFCVHLRCIMSVDKYGEED